MQEVRRVQGGVVNWGRLAALAVDCLLLVGVIWLVLSVHYATKGPRR